MCGDLNAVFFVFGDYLTTVVIKPIIKIWKAGGKSIDILLNPLAQYQICAVLLFNGNIGK